MEISNFMMFLLIVVAILLSGVVALIVYHTHFPCLRKYVVNRQSCELGQPSCKVLHLTDLHIRRFGLREKLAFRLARRADPDLIIITGDIIRRKRNYRESAVLNFLRQLGSDIPVYVVRGNAEFMKPDARDPLAFMGKLPNVKILSNEVVARDLGGKTLSLIGLDPYVDTTQNFATKSGNDGLHISGGGSWVDCFYSLQLQGDEFRKMQGLKHYFVEGCVKLQSANDLAGVLVCSQIPYGQDRFYRLTFGGGYPARFSSHGTRIDIGERFSKRVLPTNVWHKYKIEVEIGSKCTRLRAKIWLQNEREPRELLLECGDSSKTRIANGTIGFWSSRGGGIREYTLEKIYDLAEKREFMLDNNEPGRLFEEHFVDEAPWSDLARLGTKDKLAELLARVPDKSFNILLCHDPDVVNFLPTAPVHLVLSGHTHGGQVRIPFLQKYFYGRAVIQMQKAAKSPEPGRPPVVINKGLGTSGLPIRMGARCEMVLLET